MDGKLIAKVAVFAAVAISAFAYFSVSNDEAMQSSVVTEPPQQGKLESQAATQNSAIDGDVSSLNKPVVSYTNESGELVLGEPAKISTSKTQQQGSQAVRHLGKRLDPETHVAEGAPELIAKGPKLDPERVYPDSGAQQLQQVGERIHNVDTYRPEGAPEPRFVGETIRSDNVYDHL